MRYFERNIFLVLLQLLHPWHLSLWVFIFPFWLNPFPHDSQLNGLVSECNGKCSATAWRAGNFLSHCGQLCLKWVTKCTLKLFFSLKVSPHFLHRKLLEFLLTTLCAASKPVLPFFVIFQVIIGYFLSSCPQFQFQTSILWLKALEFCNNFF